MASGSYRIGLLVDGTKVPKWVADLCCWLRDNPRFALAALIVVPRARKSSLLDRLLRLETRLFRNIPEVRGFAALHSIAGCASLEILLPASNASRRSHGSGPGAAEEAVLEGLGLDALVACGRAPPDPALLRFARDGILAVEVGAGGPDEVGTGLSEILAGTPATAFTIERKAADASGETLFSGSVATSLFLASNVAAVHARAFQYLRPVLERLALDKAAATAAVAAPAALAAPAAPGALAAQASGAGLSLPPASLGRPARVPARQLALYALKTARRSAGKAARRLFGREFHWQLGFSREPWWNCDPAQGTPIPNPPGTFLADPFAIAHEGRDYLFVEEYSFARRKGVICAYELVGKEAARIGPVLEEPYHLSFPFVFRHQGEMFMVPESGAGRSVRLYRSTAFPGGWSLAKVLMSDVPAVDPILFEHEGRWWLFATIKGDGPALNNAELHAFHAEDLFGDWAAHRCNPIVMDATRGRNGGFLRDCDGTPCRVAQVPGFTFYGEQAAIFRIEELTPDTYRERLVRKLMPDFLPRLDGTHHMSGNDRLTLFDFMRVERPPLRAPEAGRVPAPPSTGQRVPARLSTVQEGE